MKAIRGFALGITALSLWAANLSALRAGDEHIGTSIADAPNLNGMFTVSNNSTFTITYSVKWGNEEWKKTTVGPRMTGRHWHPLDGNRRAPRPQLSFKTAPGARTSKTFDLKFYAVGFAGYGPKPNLTGAKEYEFRDSPNGASVDLHER
jgi:hypothetical protein